MTGFSYYFEDELLSFKKEGENFAAELLMEDYGFLEPENIIRLQTAEGEEVLYIGNYNSFVSGYYLKVNGDEETETASEIDISDETETIPTIEE